MPMTFSIKGFHNSEITIKLQDIVKDLNKKGQRNTIGNEYEMTVI